MIGFTTARRIGYLIALMGFGGAWEYLAGSSPSVRLLVSSPSRMWMFFSQNTSDVLVATRTTLIEATLGLVLATAVAFAVMFLCFFRPRLIPYVLPAMVVSQVIPLIVLAPFFVIALGIGMASKVAMAAVLSFFPTFVNMAQGFRLIDSRVHELLEVYDTPTAIRIAKAYLPLSLPNIAAGLKVSATLAVIGAIVAEFAGAQVGIGKNLFLSAIRLEPDLMMVSVICAAVIGASLYSAISLIERQLGHWYL